MSAIKGRGNSTERTSGKGPGAHSADGDELDKNEAPELSQEKTGREYWYFT
ncbi:hypothetical protein PQR70_02540 [Paraburkholderia madseniana]|uniref:Uncharacterized protein n=1 Tax=Paraburkholderia madseniana TaxID=2599607 RepID=A0AAP5BB17_9BURK|nr:MULTISPECIES: hypothetical protein [Paraburkholderia]MCP2084734.1 hypothetical protein [Paraburkholderia sediminicola]MBK3817077.1 hypothetical protein [Paraburkholderia aspalathi]MBK3828929.1 hypothetical protein [Paraburkholderia aspalathi]MBK3858614.1 hypothetical protein [Paraburkholderia aspalathi]MCX4145431.1 hypothetical protein [Paraburkholderia madseniana]